MTCPVTAFHPSFQRCRQQIKNHHQYRKHCPHCCWTDRVTSLDREVRFYCDRGIAESMRRTYKSGLTRFLSFCNVFSVTNPFPVSESLLCYFVTYLASQGISPATIKTYLAAVRNAQILRGHPEPRHSSSLPRLQLLQSGVRREALHRSPATVPRLPITTAILSQVRRFCVASPGLYDPTMLWAVMTLCFFGFFRAGELTVPGTGTFDPAIHLAWGDVAISTDQPPVIRVFLKRSKTDQYGRGVAVYVGATGNDLCPVRAVTEYVARRGDAAGAFFCLEDGRPLSKSQFVARVRQVLSRAGIDISGYSGHSFRIGAATAAARAGLEDSAIQSLGRWSSAAFLTYIRTPREQLARFTSALGQNAPS